MLVGVAWSLLNWYLSLAAIFVVSDGAPRFAALAAATDLCRSRPGSLAAAVTWFGAAHTAMFVIATSAAAFPLGFAEVLPGGMVLGGVLLVYPALFRGGRFLFGFVCVYDDPGRLMCSMTFSATSPNGRNSN